MFFFALTGEHNDRVFSRAKAKLVIVCNEECIKEEFISRGSYSNNHALKINVNGETVKSTFVDKLFQFPSNSSDSFLTKLHYFDEKSTRKE